MRNLLNFLAKYNNLIIFLILEGVAISLISNGNNYHNTRIVRGIGGITKGLEERITITRSYFHLREINQVLAAENTSLKNTIERITREGEQVFFSVPDTIYSQQYLFTTARIVDNSVNKQKNFFTINKGEKDGLKADMAVTSQNGIAGVILGCSRNYSVAMSLLNLDFRVSARIRSNGYFGSLGWDGHDNRYAVLNEIPQHVTVRVGDTIETSGFSATFPEGIMIGTVSDYETPGGDFYTIQVLLNTDFRKLQHVNVIADLHKEEKEELEESFQ